jgi:hypothetical protein
VSGDGGSGPSEVAIGVGFAIAGASVLLVAAWYARRRHGVA